MTTATEPKKETLFSLSEDLLALDALLTESGGELTPEVEAWIAESRDKFSDKIDGFGWYWRTIEARVAGLKLAQEELTAKRAVEERKLERLKGYVRLCLNYLGTDKAKGQVYSLSIQKNGGKPPLRILPPFDVQPELLPAGYQRVSVTADKDAIRADMEKMGGLQRVVPVGEGEPQPIAEILPVGDSVRLR